MRISIPPQRRLRRSLALASIATLALVPAAQAGSGGVGSGGGGGGNQTVNGDKAKLSHGKAIAPENAPPAIRDAIDGANKIAKGHGYCTGGGHGDWNSKCYDCSGAVSYVLHKAGLLNTPLDSSALGRWAAKGKGNWMTVYGNSGHAYMKIAGLRFDTADTAGDGPGWAKGDGWESSQHYSVRHKARL